MGDDIYNLDKGVSSIASRTTSIGRNVSNIYFAQFEQGEVSIEWRWLSFQLDLQHYVYYFCSIWSTNEKGSMMRVEVWGGAGEYGRSCYFVKNKETKILFDCGINRSYKDSYPKIEREVVPF